MSDPKTKKAVQTPFEVFYSMGGQERSVIEVPEHVRENFMMEALGSVAKLTEQIMFRALDNGAVDLSPGVPLSDEDMAKLGAKCRALASRTIADNLLYVGKYKKKLKARLKTEYAAPAIIPVGGQIQVVGR